jgi:hypothetical protein
MKISTIRNTLIKQTIVAFVIVGIFIGIVMYVDTFNEECDRNISRLKSESDNIITKVADLSLEYHKVLDYMPTYNEIKQKQGNKLLMVNKLALRDAIAGVRTKYYLDNLDVKMDEIKPLTGDKYKRSTSFIEASNVTIGLNGLTDLDIFGLVKILAESFPGLKFNSIKVSLEKSLDNNALIAVKDTGFSPIVNAKLAFTLFGLRDVNSPNNELIDDPSKDSPQNYGADNNGKKRIRIRRP